MKGAYVARDNSASCGFGGVTSQPWQYSRAYMINKAEAEYPLVLWCLEVGVFAALVR